MDTVALVITGQLNWFFLLIRMWLPSEVGALIRIRDGYSFVGLPFDKQECIISSEGPCSPSSSPLRFTAADEKLAQKRALTRLSRGSSNHTHAQMHPKTPLVVDTCKSDLFSFTIAFDTISSNKTKSLPALPK